jgi:hypothetical protein
MPRSGFVAVQRCSNSGPDMAIHSPAVQPSSLLAKLTTAAIATARIIAPRAIALANHLSLNIDQASSPNIALQAAILNSATTLRSCPPRMPGTLTVDNLN